MNILRLGSGEGGAVVAGTKGPMVLRGEASGLLAGVRPEDVRLMAHDGGPGLCARVTGVEYLGADSIVTCVAGSEGVAVRVPGRLDVEGGSTVRLSWRAGALHVFDAPRGHRLDEAARAGAVDIDS